MNYCDKCGGPLRDIRSYDIGWLTMGGCRLCWLEEVAGDTPLWAWSGTEEAANSTANTPATSRWLPPGQRELRPARSSTERACQMWLRDVQEREEAGEWQRDPPRALNAPTFDDYMRAIIREVHRNSTVWLDPPVFTDIDRVVVFRGSPVDEDDIVRRVMDGPARRV